MAQTFVSINPCNGKSVFQFLLVAGLMILSTMFLQVEGVTYGDEQYGNLPGYFYTFNTSGFIAIVNPVSNTVVKTLTVSNPTGTISWGDVVYIRDQAQLKHYAFASDSTNNRVIVIDTDSQTVISKPVTGVRPLHIYAVPGRDEVWTHLDGEGSFDVFHMSQVRYRSISGVKARAGAVGAHGKLLTGPNLENTAFATLTAEGKIFEIDLSSRQVVGVVDITANGLATGVIASSTLGCVGTHGIAFSDVNGRIYVECSNPSTCVAPYNSASNCTGSTWSIDALSLNTTERLVSPLLSTKYGSAWPINGQIYATPEEQFLLVPNKNQAVLHIIRPVAGGASKILEVNVTGHLIGAITFYPKDSTITFGEDPNPGNYWAIIALEDTTANSGFVMLDMAKVVTAFANNAPELQSSELVYVSVGVGAGSRFVERGLDYIITAINTGANPTSIGITNIKSSSAPVIQTLNLPGVKKAVWIPIHTGELAYKLNQQAATVATVQANAASTKDTTNSNTDSINSALVLGAIAFSLSGILCIVVIILAARGSSNNGTGKYSAANV